MRRFVHVGAGLLAVVLVALTTTTADARAANVEVGARHQWTATGRTVHAGDTLTIRATGTMHLGAARIASVAPGGAPCDALAPGTHPVFPQPKLLCYGLVGRIGAQTFDVGNARTLRAPADGALLLGVNDNYLGDNSGSWRAAVDVTGTGGSSPSAVLALAAIAVAGIVAAAVILVRRRRRKPAPQPEPEIVLPADPAGFDVNIFEVDLPDRSTLRVGYSFFPTGTEVHWTIVDDDYTVVTGAFVALGGGSRAHVVSQPVDPPVVADRAEVHFAWTIGDVPFHYSVRRQLTLL